ncbi:hypothetical protein IW492_03670 [Enterococcus sp. BWB1-3]|uniref:hypothetical protein n=1 Tax=unclassified Enterococcus TaxID=2608891 RepID=UPI001924DCDB|nr:MULTISPECIES: hypothetical protein [unclassified Enterococcus]MBL1228330.1 hypothetical protein [Enterococcus sp. BWB1-3]MCB5954907.1 hypothetical protein [Enterococcus sp. CWB-B31]
MDNTIKNKHYVIYVKNFFYRSLKIRCRAAKETFYSDIATLIFFFFEFLLLHLFNLFRVISKTREKSTNNSPVNELQAVNKEPDLNFLLLTVKTSLFMFIVGLLILGIFRYFVYLSQKIIIQKDDIETKLLLGATPVYVSFEMIVEVLFGLPFLGTIGYLLSRMAINKFVFLLGNMFPIGHLFKDSIPIFSIETILWSISGMVVVFIISVFFVNKSILRVIN